MNINPQYKDSVFSLLFSDPDILRELYCALENVTLPPDTPVTINTLQNIFYMDFINDISMLFFGKRRKFFRDVSAQRSERHIEKKAFGAQICVYGS